MTTRPFPPGLVPLGNLVGVKRRYSVTADVLGFRRCARQYGAFRIYKYAPAEQTQLFYGTIVHQVLDRAHAHFHGVINPALRGTLPTDSEIEGYFNEVEKGLRSRGIRKGSGSERDRALRVLKHFNSLEGPTLYPRVVDTEHRLQADNGDHLLFGVVDLLVWDPAAATSAGACEIWDYKGSRRLYMTTKELEAYEFQMRVYAHLYERRHGVRPSKAVLYFLNELDFASAPTSRPVNAVFEVDLSPREVARAVAEFSATVRQIDVSRGIDQWPAPPTTDVSLQTCTVCDLRWDCPTGTLHGAANSLFP